ncbi:MAG TPA: EAL domain-containing response regulator [Woeseiaceae bacterium]|nr:EAL domain-containing response regulator [Woeseiaceae bacterium]
MQGAKKRLLIVDDEPAICTIITRVAEPLGFRVQSLNDSGRFLQTLKDFRPSLLILDLKMPGVDGVQLLHQVKEGQSDAQVMVVSGMDQRVLNTAEKLGRSQGLQMLGVLQKPLQRADLERRLKEALNAGQTHSRGELMLALRARQFVVHYQPKIARKADGWRVTGAEALVRWQHPQQGLLPPGEFLALMEEYQLMDELTDFVLDSAIQQAAAWKKAGMPLRVAVNLSASLAEDMGFPNRLTALLQKHGLPGNLLTIELTESTAMADATKAMDIFLRLCVNDVSLSIDDFGTGFSSLQQLYQLPFDELKIDRMFIGGLPDDDEARAIVRATVDMAHALNITVCAEGVETRAALDYLESVNCDRAQGFLVGAAVPAAEIERIVHDWNPASVTRGA